MPAGLSPEPQMHQPILRVVGVGGAGVNAVDRMIEAGVEGVEFIAVNTDLQSLERSAAPTKVHIGSEATRGLGSGANPELGRQAAIEEYDSIKALLKGADMVFITAGAGGGTGTGAAPSSPASRARWARSPSASSPSRSRSRAPAAAPRPSEGIEEFAAEVDTLIVIPNSRLLTVLDKQTSMVEAFRVADDVLRQGVQGISDLITLPGLINLDFADVRTIMSEAGQALLGIGMGTGDSRAIDAVEHAIESPLLETSLEGAQSILLSITGGRDLSLFEVNDAAKAVADVAHPDANIIFGAMVDEKMGDEVWITVVATGYGEQPTRREAARPERAERGSAASVPIGSTAPTAASASRPTTSRASAAPHAPTRARWATWTCPSSCPEARSQPPEGGSRSRSSAAPPRRGPTSCAKAATPSMPRSPLCSCRSWPSRRSPAPARAASCSSTPPRARAPCSTSSSRRRDWARRARGPRRWSRST